MQLSIIGAGNVAKHLAHYLSQNNTIKQIYSRSFNTAQTLAQQVGACAIANINELQEVDFLIIAISDDQIAKVAASIQLKNTCIVHTSGTLSIDHLAGHNQYGLLYPLQTFTKERIVDFSQIPVFIEGNNKAVFKKIECFASANFQRIESIELDKRQYLHTGAVLVNNFVNHLMDKTQNFLSQQDIDFSLLFPLIKETIEKLEYNEAKVLQTGPAKRGDQATIDKHLDLIQDIYLKKIYQLMSQSIASSAT